MGRNTERPITTDREATIRRLENELAQHQAAARELDKLCAERDSHNRAIIELETRIKVERETLAQTSAPRETDAIRERVYAITIASGTVTISALRSLMGAEVPIHQLERALKSLVDAGLLEGTDETGRPVHGRGRSPQIYRPTSNEATDSARLLAADLMRQTSDTGEVAATSPGAGGASPVRYESAADAAPARAAEPAREGYGRRKSKAGAK